jgi:hypothetical protein
VRKDRWTQQAATIVAAAAALGMGLGEAQAAPAGSNVRLVNVVHKDAVARAVEAASRLFEDPECQALLDDFQDAAGRPLRVSVEALGVSAPEYLGGRIFFYDAPEPCAPGVLAYTAPGSRAILVCGARFVRQMSRGARHAEAALIHEALHSLGLGENPPSSDYITERVRARCGR